MKTVMAFLSCTILSLSSLGKTQETIPGTTKIPSHTWEYLAYFERLDDKEPHITVGYGSDSKNYTLEKFAGAIGSEQIAGFYLNWTTDVPNYFGRSGWEIAGIYIESEDRGGPRLVMYFKRPTK